MDMWASFIEEEGLVMNDELLLWGRGAAVLGSELIRCVGDYIDTVEV